MTYPPQPPQGQPYRDEQPYIPGQPSAQARPPAQQYASPVAAGLHPLQGQPAPPQWIPPAPGKRWPLPAIFGVIAAMLVGLCLVSAAINNFSKDGTSSSTSGSAKVIGLGQPARDGKFEFVVSKVVCGQATVGSGLFKSTAQGSYCLVSVNVSNIGKQAQSFDGSDQKAYAGSTQFSDDGAAEFNADAGALTWSQDINPGNQVAGVLVYDVPDGTKLTSIVLHDSVFSDGVRVTLK